MLRRTDERLNKNNQGMTILELARAFQVNEEEIEMAIQGTTVGVNEKGEELIYWQDIPDLRSHFFYGNDIPFWD